jgi:hypothetical protein
VRHTDVLRVPDRHPRGHERVRVAPAVVDERIVLRGLDERGRKTREIVGMER